MEIINRLTAEECASLEDVRSEIDYLDRAVIALLGQRFKYVLAAARFKTSATAVRAPERQKAMLAQRREWAEAEGLNPDAIEKLYTDLVQHFVEEEMKRWKANRE